MAHMHVHVWTVTLILLYPVFVSASNALVQMALVPLVSIVPKTMPPDAQNATQDII